MGDGVYTVGYYDDQSRTLFRWRGVQLDRAALPKGGPFNKILAVDATDPRVDVIGVDPPVQYVVLENNEIGVGYVMRTGQRRVFLWDQVRVPRDALPRQADSLLPEFPVLDVKRDALKISTIKPEVRYLVVGKDETGKALAIEPGYFDHTRGRFLRWRGVEVDAANLTEDAHGRLISKENTYGRVIDIVPPDDAAARIAPDFNQ